MLKHLFVGPLYQFDHLYTENKVQMVDYLDLTSMKTVALCDNFSKTQVRWSFMC